METEGKETEATEPTDEGHPGEGHICDDGSCIGDSDDDFEDTVGANLITSMLKQKSSKSYIGDCEVCGKGFTSVPGAKFHRKYHHSDGKLYCLQCKKPFKVQTDLDRHMKTHTGERPFDCPECDKSFICKSSLMQHLRQQHIVGNVFECEVCSRKFCTNTDLQRHFRIHTGIKPFKCDRCDKCFTCKSSLNVHKRTHEGKKFVCSYCQVKFYIKSDLKRHETTHTGKKPWKCGTCDKSYSCKSTLKVHEKNMHGIFSDREIDDDRSGLSANDTSTQQKIKRIKVDCVDRVIHAEIDTTLSERLNTDDRTKEALKEKPDENKSVEVEDEISKDIHTLKQLNDNTRIEKKNTRIEKNIEKTRGIAAADVKAKSGCSKVDGNDVVRTEGVEADADGMVVEGDDVDTAIEGCEETASSDMVYIDKAYTDIDGLNKRDGAEPSDVMVMDLNDSLTDSHGSKIVKRAEISDDYLVVLNV